jgi:membrane protein implicated in regulation of membrane protease activity
MHAERLCASFVESGLCLPVSVSAMVSAAMVLSKGLELSSAPWLFLGSLASAAMTAVLLVGQARLKRLGSPKENAKRARARYENRRASIRSLSDRKERGHRRCTNRYAGRYKVGTEPKGKSE